MKIWIILKIFENYENLKISKIWKFRRFENFENLKILKFENWKILKILKFENLKILKIWKFRKFRVLGLGSRPWVPVSGPALWDYRFLIANKLFFKVTGYVRAACIAACSYPHFLSYNHNCVQFEAPCLPDMCVTSTWKILRPRVIRILCHYWNFFYLCVCWKNCVFLNSTIFGSIRPLFHSTILTGSGSVSGKWITYTPQTKQSVSLERKSSGVFYLLWGVHGERNIFQMLFTPPSRFSKFFRTPKEISIFSHLTKIILLNQIPN